MINVHTSSVQVLKVRILNQERLRFVLAFAKVYKLFSPDVSRG